MAELSGIDCRIGFITQSLLLSLKILNKNLFYCWYYLTDNFYINIFEYINWIYSFKNFSPSNSDGK